MALTQGFVVKLILKYIGGSRIRGNPSKVDIGGKVAMVKAGVGGLPGIAGVVGNLTNQFSSITDIASNLMNNPLAEGIQAIGSNISKVQAEIASLGLPMDTLNTLSSSMNALNSAVGSFNVHTSVLSGLIDNVEVLNENQMSLSDLSGLGKIAMDNLGMSKEEVLQSASSLYAHDMADSINRSINPDIPGGLTDILGVIKMLEPSDTATINHYVALFTDIADQHRAEIDAKRQADLEAQQALKLKIDTFDMISSVVPEDDNEIAQELFNVTATDTLKNLSSQLV